MDSFHGPKKCSRPKLQHRKGCLAPFQDMSSDLLGTTGTAACIIRGVRRTRRFLYFEKRISRRTARPRTNDSQQIGGLFVSRNHDGHLMLLLMPSAENQRPFITLLREPGKPVASAADGSPKQG